MPGRKAESTRLQVLVQDALGEIVSNAAVQVKPKGRGDGVKLAWDERTRRYVADGLPCGQATLLASGRGYQPQSREITLGASPGEELVILGKKGGRTYFRGKVRVPVQAEPGLIGVTFARRAQADSLADELEGLAGLRSRAVPEAAARLGMRLFELTEADSRDALERLDQHPLVEEAGAVVAVRETGFTHLTRDVIVRFRGRSADQVQAIAREHGYALVRELPYAPSTFVLRWDRPATLEILDSIERLATRDDVEWAEPNLVASPELDAIIPTDYLWPGLWDRQLIGVQHAYQHLQDAGLPSFGDPDLVLAVIDSGVQSVGGVPTNADFTGTVSNGQPKLFATFDFGAMVANNDDPWGDHGSGVAGVAVASANNPSPIGGIGHGLSGSAPNVRMMTIAAGPDSDLLTADTYIWMAGFDPQSPTPGFPAPLPRGVDVITCSLGLGAGSPLSGIARATLDFVTTFGRGGKGTMCFFSTGNQNQNNVVARPYGAYEKCFAIAATSFANDGVTEIRGPYSGWGQIAFCAPSHDQTPPFHNPPTRFGTWGGHYQGQGNLIAFPQTQTTLAAASAAGATTVTVASTAGIAVNAVLHIGAVGVAGSEPARVTAVNPGTGQLTVQGFSAGGSFSGGLIHPHASGAVVATGPANHRNDFGGTSSATPLAAGAAALVLSANPSLTYIEAREILRSTAVKFDLANTDPNGQWLDADGNPSVTSGQPAVKSAWYGYGRIDAGAAVGAAVSFVQNRDLVLRDNIADSGAVASSGAFWDSPDIWCRRLAPGTDPGALPANYMTPGPHLDPERGQDNWIYLRVRNKGTAPSLDAWVRVSVTHFPGMEFTYPASWQPSNGPGDPVPVPMTPGTYFIGEVKLTSIAADGEQIVSLVWPEALIPPDDVATGSGTVEWHPCLLAEITPHDGPPPSGNHVWDDNNLAQKNISIIDMVTDLEQDFQTAIVVGHEDNRADFLTLEVNRGSLPRQVQLFVEMLDPVMKRRFRNISEAASPRLSAVPDRPGVGDILLEAIKAKLPDDLVAAAKALLAARRGWQAGRRRGRDAVLLTADRKVQIPLPVGAGRLATVAVGGVVPKDTPAGEYDVVLVQRQPNGDVSGSAALRLSIARKRKKSGRS